SVHTRCRCRGSAARVGSHGVIPLVRRKQYLPPPHAARQPAADDAASRLSAALASCVNRASGAPSASACKSVRASASQRLPAPPPRALHDLAAWPIFRLEALRSRVPAVSRGSATKRQDSDNDLDRLVVDCGL